jgi:tetratricopeptide (TPR) repeat protein
VPPRAAPAAPRPAVDALALTLPATKADAAKAKAATSGTSDPYLGADLPAVSPGRGAVDLPAPARPKQPSIGDARAPEPAPPRVDLPSSSSDDDLPAIPSARAPEAMEVDADLPAVVTGGHFATPRAAAAAAPRAAAPAPPDELDLPAPRAPGFELDLPDVGVAAKAGRGTSSTFDLDLPDLPDVGLPAPAAGLPMPAAGLPMPAAGLPARAVDPASLRETAPEPPAFGELDLDLGPAPAPTSGAFGEIELPPVIPSNRPAAPTSIPAAPLSIPAEGPDSLEADPFGEAPIPVASPAPARPSSQPPGAAITRAGGGGTSYGEVNLEGGGGSGVDVEAPVVRSMAPRPEEDMEFGAVPQEGAKPAATAALQPGMPALATRTRPRWPLRVFGALLVVAVAGGALSFVPALGPYGAYWVSDRIHASDHARLLADSETATRKAFGHDTFPEAQHALADLDAAQARAKRVEPLAAYLAFSGYLSELRFGKNPAVHAQAKVLLAGIDDPKVKHVAAAKAAALALDGSAAEAASAASSLVQSHPDDVDARVLLAEATLRSKDAASAASAWDAVEKLEPSARAAFGAARAKYAAGSGSEAAKLAKVALERTPTHVGARLLLARIEASQRGSEAESIATIEGILKDPAKASPDEIVLAETLLGDIHLARGHVALAQAAYGRALKVNPSAASALVGFGEALFQAGRYSEALARFEAASQAEADNVPAQVGMAKSKLLLERFEDATKSLAALAQAAPTDAVVGLWYGRALEAANDRDRANAVYRNVIEKAKPSPELVNVYVALATLENGRGQAEDAQKTLDAAKKKLPDSGPLHRALGHLALEQARLPDAVAEFRRALALDDEDLASRFELGVALRRSQKYDEATKIFDQVAAVDKEHPGLALERGLIFEATGHAEEALKAYEGALAKAPNDPDLMLRVGCGSVSAGRAVAAEELLRKVLVQRPASPEVNHCLGRALLAQDKVPDAQRLFDHAIELDPRRAEYHLYSGWAANEAGNVSKAEKELAAALAIDSSLADAYWQRGVLRAHQGAVKDAVADLTNALKLNPGLSAAHAALADTYYDLGREHEALAEWQKAVEAQPDNAVWRFRYGKLLVTNQMNDAGRAELEKAVAWAEKQEQPPRWLWEAHHFLARSLGGRPEAASHWEAFLRLGPRDSPYRAEAKDALKKLGRPWSGD